MPHWKRFHEYCTAGNHVESQHHAIRGKPTVSDTKMRELAVPDLPRTAMDWVRVFGSGAIIASMTIGTGELIFSTRGGAIFGYQILFLFVIISLLKWGLVVTTARHFVLTGVHPYFRMLQFPGPKGWLPAVPDQVGEILRGISAKFLSPFVAKHSRM